MSKSLLSIFLAFALILVTLPPSASAWQGNVTPQEKEKKKKGKSIWERIDSFDPEKAIDSAINKITGEKRDWTEKQKQDANTAQALFRFPPSSASVGENSNSHPVYDPTDTAAAQEMAARVEAVKARYGNRQSLTPNEEQEIVVAVTPFLRYAEAAGVSDVSERDLQPATIKADATGRIQIPPRSQAVVKLKTVCKDFTAPTPQAGEKMHFVPAKGLVKQEFQPIYKALVAYSHNHQDEQSHAQIQRITWNLRHGCFKDNDNLRAMRLRPEDEMLLDSLVLGASRTIKDKCKKFDFKKFSKDLLRATLTGGGRLDINPAGLVDANQSVIRVVQAQTRMNVSEPIPDDNSDYSLLQEGVAVRSRHTQSSASETELIINNATDPPATFTPDEWSLESRRTVQRLGIVGVEEALVYAIIGAVVVMAVLAAMFFTRFAGAGQLASLLGRFRVIRGLRPGGVAGGPKPSTRSPTEKPPGRSSADRPSSTHGRPKGNLTIDAGRSLSTGERDIANKLVREGRQVRAVAESKTGRTADFIVDGVRTEVKHISNLTGKDMSAGLSRRILDGSSQAPSMIMDVRGQTGMTREIAERAVRRAYGHLEQRGSSTIQNVRVVGKDFDLSIPFKIP